MGRRKRPKKKPPWFSTRAFERTVAIIGLLIGIASLVISLIR